MILKICVWYQKHDNFIFIEFIASFVVGNKRMKGFKNDLYKIYQVSVCQSCIYLILVSKIFYDDDLRATDVSGL